MAILINHLVFNTLTNALLNVNYLWTTHHSRTVWLSLLRKYNNTRVYIYGSVRLLILHLISQSTFSALISHISIHVAVISFV